MPKRQTVEQRLKQARVEMGGRIGDAMRAKGVTEKRRVTQREVAEAAEVSEATVSDLLKGKKPTGKDVILRVADYLGTTSLFLEYGIVGPEKEPGEQKPLTKFTGETTTAAQKRGGGKSA